MRYSVFDPVRGLYRYYDTPGETAVNADMPMPKLKGKSVNGLGVPAQLAGRELPAGATLVGEGWHAMGLVAQPEGALGSVSLHIDDGSTKADGTVVLFGIAAAIAGGWYLYARYKR